MKQLFTWAGVPGAIAAYLLFIGLIGSAGTYYIGAPAAAIPVIDLLALLLAPFPTLALYGAALLVTFVGARIALGLIVQSLSVAQWGAGAFSLAAVAFVGFGLPLSWNRAAGVTAPSPQTAPSPVAVPKGGVIALITKGEAPYAGCDALCFSLLLQEQVRAVKVVETPTEPAPLAVLPGKRFTLTPQTRQCLKGLPDYSLFIAEPNRYEEFITFGGVPPEYEACLDSQAADVNPADQTTLVQWGGSYAGETGPLRAGYSREVSVMRTLVPRDRSGPIIREGRYRSGWKYYEPLLLWPYAGNAAVGSYFSLSISAHYFEEPGFPDTSSPKLWGLLQGSEELGKRTAAWLDTVVAQRETSQP